MAKPAKPDPNKTNSRGETKSGAADEVGIREGKYDRSAHLGKYLHKPKGKK